LFHLMPIVDVHWTSTRGCHQDSQFNRCLLAVIVFDLIRHSVHYQFRFGVCRLHCDVISDVMIIKIDIEMASFFRKIERNRYCDFLEQV